MNADNDTDINKINEQLELISKKEALKTEVSKLELFDLSKHVNENNSVGRGGLNSSELSMLNKRIFEATSQEQLDSIKRDIDRQKNAELSDLKLEVTNGGYVQVYDPYSGFIEKYVDFSEMKKSLIFIIEKVKNIKNDKNQSERNRFNAEGQALINKIRLDTDTIEKYKSVKIEAEAFVKRWEDDTKTKNWVPFFIERVEKHSNQTPQEAGPFPVNVEASLIDSIKRTFNDSRITREEAIEAENRYLKTIYFNARRLKKLDYDYLQFIKELKQNPFLDDNELSRLDAHRRRFDNAPSVEEKERIALSIEPSLLGRRTNVRDYWKSSSQKEFVNWWVDAIVKAPEYVISQENKYMWIDRVTLTVDERKSATRALWEEFKKQYKSTSIFNGVKLTNDGYPEGKQPFFLGN